MPIGLSPPCALPLPAWPTLASLLTLPFPWSVVPTEAPDCLRWHCSVSGPHTQRRATALAICQVRRSGPPIPAAGHLFFYIFLFGGAGNSNRNNWTQSLNSAGSADIQNREVPVGSRGRGAHLPNLGAWDGGACLQNYCRTFTVPRFHHLCTQGIGTQQGASSLHVFDCVYDTAAVFGNL